MLNHIVNICQELLQNHPVAEETRNYLNKRLSVSIQKEFKIGFFPDNDNLNLISSLIPEKQLLKSELFYYRIIDGEDIFSSSLENHNLVMPYNDAYGNVVALVGRSILPDTEQKINNISKYKNTSFNKSHHLFGLDKAKRSIIKNNCVYVVEGQFDCISAQSNGLENCVAVGSSSFSFYQFALLNRYTDNIVMLLDNDEAGKRGMEKAEKDFGKLSNIKKGYIPEGYKDLDQFIMSEGAVGKEFLENI